MLLEGKFYINAKEFGKGKKAHIAYSTGITSKDSEGNKTTGYMNVQLSTKAYEYLDDEYPLEDGDSVLVNVIEGWLASYEKKDGTTGVKLFFNEIELVDEEDEEDEEELFVAPKKKTTSQKKSPQKKSTPQKKTTTTKKTTKK